MKRAIGLLAVSVSIVLATSARAGPAEDATAAVTTWLDKFNAGDMDAFYAGHRDGAVIVDEFAPYVWGGPQSAQHWLADYMKDAEARGSVADASIMRKRRCRRAAMAIPPM